MGYSCEYHRTTKAQIDAYVKSINPNYAEVVGVTGAWVKFIVKLTNKPCADLLLMHKDKEGYVWYKAISASSGPNVTNQSVRPWPHSERRPPEMARRLRQEGSRGQGSEGQAGSLRQEPRSGQALPSQARVSSRPVQVQGRRRIYLLGNLAEEQEASFLPPRQYPSEFLAHRRSFYRINFKRGLPSTAASFILGTLWEH